MATVFIPFSAKTVHNSNVYINSAAALTVTTFAFLIGLASPTVSAFRSVLIATILMGFVGFWGRINSMLNQGRNSLGIGHGFGRNILRQWIGNQRWWYGWNLHVLSLCRNSYNINLNYCLSEINKHLRSLCHHFGTKSETKSINPISFQYVVLKKGII